MTAAPRTRIRSYLYVPAHRADLVKTAYEHESDAVVFDLEDLCPPPDKDAGRELVSQVVAAPTPKPTLVRINESESGRTSDDIKAIVGPGLYAVRTPKAEEPGEIRAVARWIDEAREAAGLTAEIGLQVMVESALGIEHAFDLARATHTVWYLGIGEGDLRKNLGTSADEGLAYSRGRVVVASRAAGLPGPVQVTFPAAGSETDLRASTELGRAFGFSGRSLLNTDHIQAVNEIYG